MGGGSPLLVDSRGVILEEYLSKLKLEKQLLEFEEHVDTLTVELDE